jgi:hypothetical protein
MWNRRVAWLVSFVVVPLVMATGCSRTETEVPARLPPVGEANPEKGYKLDAATASERVTPSGGGASEVEPSP